MGRRHRKSKPPGLMQRLRWAVWPGRAKQSQTFRVLLANQRSGEIWRPVNYEQFAREGYSQNVYVARSVNVVALASATIPWLLFERQSDGTKKEILTHPVIDLMERPNPFMGRSRFLESVTAFFQIAGNSYVERIGPDNGPPKELWTLRPDRVTVLRGDVTNPVSGYRFTVGGHKQDFEFEEVLHLRTFNPLDDFYGLSYIQIAAGAIDQSNEAKKWNVNMLRNNAHPSGAFVSKEEMDDDTFDHLKAEVDEKVKGSTNAGTPLVLDGGLEWTEIGLSPKDMDWLESQNLSAREIALIFGVSPELIGDKSNKTFANYREARKALYEETVVPYAKWLVGEFNHWLLPLFGNPNLAFELDEASVPALQEERTELWKSAKEADWLTLNEKRELTGYEDIDGGDVILVSLAQVPLRTVDTTAEEPVDNDGKALPAPGANGKPVKKKRLRSSSFPTSGRSPRSVLAQSRNALSVGRRLTDGGNNG